MSTHLLLLDLDGVVVFESGPPLLPSLEILRLHQDMPRFLAALGVPVVVLTHRSRAEARRILQSAHVPLTALGGLMAAEDLFHAGLRHAGIRALAGRGLKKSLILPVIERRFGVERANVALLDDRLDNLEDLLAAGLGLAMQAPSDVTDGALQTFDFDHAVQRFTAWREGRAPGGFVRLDEATLPVEGWRRTGLNTRREGMHLFNLARVVGRNVRQRLTGRN